MTRQLEPFAVHHLEDDEGKDLFGPWLEQVVDVKARAAIAARIIRLQLAGCRNTRRGARLSQNRDELTADGAQRVQ